VDREIAAAFPRPSPPRLQDLRARRLNTLSYDFLTPPALLVSLCLAGAWLAWYRPAPGIFVMLVAATFLYVAAMPVVASLLLSRIEAKIPAASDFSAAGAIVVLGGGVHRGGAGESDTLGIDSLGRVEVAAQAWRRLRLPVLVAGGVGRGARVTAAARLMRQVLENEFGVPVKWTEDASRTTYENALYSARILNAAHIGTVVVVTDAWHMPRALWCFARVGLKPLPWPGPRQAMMTDRIDDFLPSLPALAQTGYALHELIGLAYYRLHY
jgi:uncharacterized SAM-binding protein YcdF (DUF218 family)